MTTRRERETPPVPKHPSDVAPARRRSLRISRRTLWLLAIPVVALILVLYYRSQSGPGYPLDDSWIHLAFARHLAHGEGFGINPGQWSTGSTSPLWTLMLSAGFFLGANHTGWPWLLGIVTLMTAGLTAAIAIRRLLALRGEERGPAVVFAPMLGGLLTVTSSGLVWSAAGAMEAPLFATLLLLAWCERIRDELPAPARGRLHALWGIPAGLAILARPEGILFAVLLALSSRTIRSALLNLLLSFAIYAPYAIFCVAATGRIWPATFYAKTSRAIAGLPDLGYALRSLGLIADLMPVLVALLAAGLLLWLLGAILVRTSLRSGDGAPGAGDRGSGPRATRGRLERWQAWRPYLPGILFVIGLPLAYASMGRTFLFAGVAGNFGRYYFPLAPFIAILGAYAAICGAARWHGRLRRKWIVLAIAGFCGWSAGVAFGRASFFAHSVRDVNAMQVEMAHRLPRDLPPRSLVAANDVGALAYFTDLRVLDLVGIVSPEVQDVLVPLRHRDRRTRQEALFMLLLEQRPLAIVVFPQWYREILQSLGPALQPLEEIRVPGNITSGQDALVAYRVNWPPE